MSDINQYGELAPWDTTSRKYRRNVKRLTRQGRKYPSHNSMSCYQLGLLTWEHARALVGWKSDPKDPLWGRFRVPWDFTKTSYKN